MVIQAQLTSETESDDEVEPADVDPQPASTSDAARKRSRTPYSVEKKQSQEKARLIKENGTVMDPPCIYCQKKMEKHPELNHQCMRDEDVSFLCQLCVMQKNICSANPYKGQRVKGRKREGWDKGQRGKAAVPEQKGEETGDEASEQGIGTQQKTERSSSVQAHSPVVPGSPVTMRAGIYQTVMREIGGKMCKVIICPEDETSDEQSEDGDEEMVEADGSDEELDGLFEEHKSRLRIDWHDVSGIL